MCRLICCAMARLAPARSGLTLVPPMGACDPRRYEVARSMKKVYAFVLLLCVLQSVSAARIEPKPESDFCSSMSIRIFGDIQSGDAARLDQAIQLVTREAKRVFGECLFPPTVL